MFARSLALIGSLALAVGCKVVPASPDVQGPTGRSTVISTATGDSLRLHVGDTVRAGPTPLAVVVTSVANDSRCPKVVQCVWAGSVDVAVRVRGAGETRDAVLQLNGRTPSLEIAGQRLELVGIEPEARSGRPITLDEYIAVLRLTNAGAPPAPDAVVGDTTRILLGQAARFDGGRLVLGFQSIEEESRCPANATCVQMGNAEVSLSVTENGQRVGTMNLNTSREPRHVTTSGYDVALVTLEPYPGTIPPNVRMAASVLVVVTRR